MRIELRDTSRRRVGTVQIDDAARPTRVTTSNTGREVFLNWETAVDDAGQLRRCVACGCENLFQEKAFPQVTGIVVVLAFAGAIAGILGFATNLPVLTAMVVVLTLDVGILLFSRRRLVCYRCRTSYHELPIARYHRSWDRATADRHPFQAEAATDEDETRAMESAEMPKATARSHSSIRAPEPGPTSSASPGSRPGKAPFRRQGFTI